jgi:predicted metal-dependent hydrolase
MNHSPAFWAVVARLRPDWRAQRDWLKREGGSLHAFAFSPRD